MDGKTLKAFIFVFFLLLALFPGSRNCFAQTAFYSDQEDNSSDLQVDEDHSDQVVNEVHETALKMKNDEKRLEELELKVVQKDVDQSNTESSASETADYNNTLQEAPTQAVSEQTAPGQLVTPQAAPVQAVVPIQEAPVNVAVPIQQAPAKVEAPVQAIPVPTSPDVISSVPTYYAPPSDVPSEKQFKLAADFSYTDYKEVNGFMEEKGPFFGIYGAYDYRPQNTRWMLNVLHLDADFDIGNVKYSEPGRGVNNIRDYMLEPRIWMGRDFAITSNTRVTPYGGLGYRFLFDHLGAVSDVGGYDRRSQYLYVPMGFEIDTHAIEGWELSLEAEFDQLIRGWQTSFLSDIDPVLPDLFNVQNHGYGLRGSIDIIKRMGRYNFLISPYIKYWHIKQSDSDEATKIDGDEYVILSGYEPDNNSTEIGVRLGVEF